MSQQSQADQFHNADQPPGGQTKEQAQQFHDSQQLPPGQQPPDQQLSDQKLPGTQPQGSQPFSQQPSLGQLPPVQNLMGQPLFHDLQQPTLGQQTSHQAVKPPLAGRKIPFTLNQLQNSRPQPQAHPPTFNQLQQGQHGQHPQPSPPTFNQLQHSRPQPQAQPPTFNQLQHSRPQPQAHPPTFNQLQQGQYGQHPQPSPPTFNQLQHSRPQQQAQPPTFNQLQHSRPQPQAHPPTFNQLQQGQHGQHPQPSPPTFNQLQHSRPQPQAQPPTFNQLQQGHHGQHPQPSPPTFNQLQHSRPQPQAQPPTFNQLQHSRPQPQAHPPTFNQLQQGQHGQHPQPSPPTFNQLQHSRDTMTDQHGQNSQPYPPTFNELQPGQQAEMQPKQIPAKLLSQLPAQPSKVLPQVQRSPDFSQLQEARPQPHPNRPAFKQLQNSGQASGNHLGEQWELNPVDRLLRRLATPPRPVQQTTPQLDQVAQTTFLKPSSPTQPPSIQSSENSSSVQSSLTDLNMQPPNMNELQVHEWQHDPNVRYTKAHANMEDAERKSRAGKMHQSLGELGNTQARTQRPPNPVMKVDVPRTGPLPFRSSLTAD
jgi:hypothetical protein